MTNQEKKEFAEQLKKATQSLDANYSKPAKGINLYLSRGVVESLIEFLEEDPVGKWIMDEDGYDEYYGSWYKCPKCGCKVAGCDADKFCPHCGARLEEEGG